MTRSTLPVARGAPDRRPSPDELHVLRAMLEQQRAFRIDQLVALASPAGGDPLSSRYPDVSRSLTIGARAALLEVQQALWRLEDGSYGACTACGANVGLARLEILPQAALCLPCQRAATQQAADQQDASARTTTS
jgi:Prokaryotic dksA/traR C4-type zinc finger